MCCCVELVCCYELVCDFGLYGVTPHEDRALGRSWHHTQPHFIPANIGFSWKPRDSSGDEKWHEITQIVMALLGMMPFALHRRSIYFIFGKSFCLGEWHGVLIRKGCKKWFKKNGREHETKPVKDRWILDSAVQTLTVLAYHWETENNINFFFSTWREIDCHNGNTFLTKWEKRAMWHVIVIIGAGALYLRCYCHQSSPGVFLSLLSLSHAYTPPPCRFYPHTPSHVLAQQHPRIQERNQSKDMKESQGLTRLSSLTHPIETKGQAPLNQSSLLFLSRRWSERTELLLERVALLERQKPQWCQVRSSNCYQMYNYNHLQPPRPFWWAKKRGR